MCVCVCVSDGINTDVPWGEFSQHSILHSKATHVTCMKELKDIHLHLWSIFMQYSMGGNLEWVAADCGKHIFTDKSTHPDSFAQSYER